MKETMKLICDTMELLCQTRHSRWPLFEAAILKKSKLMEMVWKEASWMNPTHLPLRQETQVKYLILFNPVAPVFASLLLVVLKMVASDIGNLGLLITSFLVSWQYLQNFALTLFNFFYYENWNIFDIGKPTKPSTFKFKHIQAQTKNSGKEKSLKRALLLNRYFDVCNSLFSNCHFCLS